MPRLVLKQVVKTFGAFTAVDHLDLELADGEFVSLLGPSGCGKTTTLRMVAGFMPPTEGTNEIDGQVLSLPSSVLTPERRGLTIIFTSEALWPERKRTGLNSRH